MSKIKVGDQVWFFGTDGEEWFGPYSTDWITLKTKYVDNWMVDDCQDGNTYFESKEWAIKTMIDKIKSLEQ